jgi:cell volume regulation protein A
VDKYGDVMRTFNDYVEEVPVQFIQFSVTENHPWINQPIKDIVLPPSCTLVLLERESKKIIPNGRTIINEGDTLILSGNATDTTGGISLSEKVVSQDDELHDKRIYELPESDDLIIMINRADKIIIPRGSTKLKVGDVLVINNITQ